MMIRVTVMEKWIRVARSQQNLQNNTSIDWRRSIYSRKSANDESHKLTGVHWGLSQAKVHHKRKQAIAHQSYRPWKVLSYWLAGK